MIEAIVTLVTNSPDENPHPNVRVYRVQFESDESANKFLDYLVQTDGIKSIEQMEVQGG